MAILQMEINFQFSYLNFNFRGEPLTVGILQWLKLAFAVPLLFWDNPSSLLNNQEEIRAHLKECLFAEVFTTFLASEKKQR